VWVRDHKHWKWDYLEVGAFYGLRLVLVLAVAWYLSKFYI
jgi:hypothetical protein